MASPWQPGRGAGFVTDLRPIVDYVSPTTQSADSAQAIPVSAVLGRLYIRNGMSAGRIDTLPSAADLVASLVGCAIGSSLPFVVINNNAGAFAVTIAAGAGGTLLAGGVWAVTQTTGKQMLIVITNVLVPAYTVYPLTAVGAL